MLLFGAFGLDIASYQLRRDGEVINVEPQVLDVISYLVQHRDRMVRKEELLDEVWGDRFVSESALTSRIKSARQALGDDGRTQAMIRTIHGRGYQFVPFVTDSDAHPAPEPLAEDPGIDDVARLDTARSAAERAAWAEARARYAEIGIDELGSADLERWAESAWWTGDLIECISVRQAAFRRYCADGEDCSAARVAIALSDDYLHRGSSTVATTWLERAGDLLESTPSCREAGQLLRTKANYELELSGDPQAALATNAQLRELAEAIDDADLVAQALQDHGRILLALGAVDDGMAMIDRAMLVAATTGTTPSTRGRLYCNMLSACVGLEQYKRAMDWSDEALMWCGTQSDSPFPGVCEVHRAGLRRRLGELTTALADLEALAGTTELSNIAGPALLEIGDIQMLRGDVAAAEDAFLRAHAIGADATVGYATVAVAQGRATDAVVLLREALEGRPHHQLARRHLLHHLVDAAAVAGDLDTARSAAAEYAQLSEDGNDVCRARSTYANATVALLEGDAAAARLQLRDAVALFRTAQLPLDLAAAQLGLAVACDALDAAAAARVERDAALAVLDGLGAVPLGTTRMWVERTAALA